MKRRTAITALPLAIAGLTTAAKGQLIPLGVISINTGALDDRALDYVLQHVTEASTTDLACTFVGFAQHISTLASAGDCEAIRAIAERLTDYLYQENNHYNETRERWISEESGLLAEYIDMDDPALSEAAHELVNKKTDERHARRGGERWPDLIGGDV